jgi:hypothetical protein
MSGMIWNAIGEGIGSVGNSVTNYLARNAEREDRQEERRRELEDRRAYERDRDEKYRRTAEQQSAGRGPSGPALLTDDEQAAIAVGQGAVSGRPEYDALWNSVKTGDRSAFKKGVEREVDVPNPENPDYDSTREKRVVQEYPPGFDDVYKAKVAKLAEIRQMSVYNKDYDDLKKGERTAQEIKRSDEAIADPSRAGIIGQGMAVGKGNDIIGGDSNVTRNRFTGATTTTPVGDSVIRENRAQAGQSAAAGNLSNARAEALKSGADPEDINAKTADLQRKVTAARARLAMELGVEENNVNGTLRSLEKRKDSESQQAMEKLRPLIDRYTGALSAMDSWTPGKTKAKEKPESDSAKTHDGHPARRNSDGSYSTELSITVTDPRLNKGRPTNIPSLWKGKEVDENTAVENAVKSGRQFKSYESIDSAVSAAKARSASGGAGQGASPPASNPAGPSMPAPKTQAEFDKLPKGARFLAPDGSTRIK